VSNKERRKEEVKFLVEKYNRLVEAGKVKSYNEEMTKKDFILPLFRALGWSVEDSEEVTAEEKVSKRTFFLLFIAFVGTALIYLDKEFSFLDKNFIGISAMLFSAVIYALTVIIFKKESEKYSKYETIFYQNVIGSIIFIPFILINKPLPTLPQTSIGIIYGALIGLVGFVFFFSALKKIKASIVSFLSYFEVVSAIILSVIFFQEVLTWNMVAGGLLIIVATTLIKKEST